VVSRQEAHTSIGATPFEPEHDVTKNRAAVIRALRAAAEKLASSAKVKAAKVKAAASGEVFIGSASSPTLGAWIKPDSDEDSLAEQIDQVLAKIRLREPDAEDWIVADYNDFPNLGENPSLENLAAVAAALEEHDLEIIKAALDFAGGDIKDALKLVDAGYAVYDNEAAFGEQYVDNVGIDNIKNIEWYFDFEKFGRDLLQDSSYGSLGGDRVVVWE
jgi:antirestriction protein